MEKISYQIKRSENLHHDLGMGKTVSLKGIAYLIFLAFIKIFGGLLTDSVSLLADGINSFSDIISLLASYIGLSWSQKRARKDFRYGFYKVESLAAILVSFLTFYLGYEVILRSIDVLWEFHEIKYPKIGATIVIISVLGTLHLAHMLEKVGNKINSPSLKNNAQDKRVGVFGTLMVLISIFASYYHIPYLEGAIGVILAFLIFKMALKNARESFLFLLDYWDDPKLVQDIRGTIKKYAHIVLEVKDIRLRRAGPVIFGEVSLEINPFANIRNLRTELDNLEREIRALNPYFKDLVLFTFIPRPIRVRVGIPIQENKGLDSKIALKFNQTKYYLFVDLVENQIKDFQVYDSVFKKDGYGQLAKFLEHHKPNILLAPDLHSLVYCLLLAKSHIDLYPAFQNIKTAGDFIKLLKIDLNF